MSLVALYKHIFGFFQIVYLNIWYIYLDKRVLSLLINVSTDSNV